MTRHDLFSTPLWHIEGTPQVLVDELYKGAYRFKKKHPSNQKTNQGGYQSPAFDWKEFQPQGIEYVEGVVSTVTVELKKNFEIIDWWYNINSEGHWNIPHTHPNSDLALVIYLTDSDGLLNFLNPHPQRKISLQNVTINAKEGDIVIFPADVMHYVMPNLRKEDRISISMNLQLW